MIQQSGMCMNHVHKFSEKFFRNFSFFFKPSLSNNFYSTLNFLSNGIQYVIFLGIKTFHDFPKYKTNL